mgnify:CR=1 FL=1
MLLVMTASLVAASMVILSDTETYSTMNYRLMTQVRYGAESGASRAADYLANTYLPPGDPSDPLAAGTELRMPPNAKLP